MPNADFHLPVAALAGAAAALTLAPQDSRPALFELLGGAVGGFLGGSAPDLIDPPTSPRHRSLGHGVLTSVAVLVLLAREAPHLQAELRHTRPSAGVNNTLRNLHPDGYCPDSLAITSRA